MSDSLEERRLQERQIEERRREEERLLAEAEQETQQGKRRKGAADDYEDIARGLCDTHPPTDEACESCSAIVETLKEAEERGRRLENEGCAKINLHEPANIPESIRRGDFAVGWDCAKTNYRKRIRARMEEK